MAADTLQRQLEFLFSDANLHHDVFLRRYIEASDGCVPTSVLLPFPRIAAYTNAAATVEKSAGRSDKLRVTAGSLVSRVVPYHPRPQSYYDARTIYIEPLPRSADHDSLSSYFARFGRVIYVSLPRWKAAVAAGAGRLNLPPPASTPTQRPNVSNSGRKRGRNGEHRASSSAISDQLSARKVRKLKGFGFVIFEDEASVADAVTAHCASEAVASSSSASSSQAPSTAHPDTAVAAAASSASSSPDQLLTAYRALRVMSKSTWLQYKAAAHDVARRQHAHDAAAASGGWATMPVENDDDESSDDSGDDTDADGDGHDAGPGAPRPVHNSQDGAAGLATTGSTPSTCAGPDERSDGGGGRRPVASATSAAPCLYPLGLLVRLTNLPTTLPFRDLRSVCQAPGRPAYIDCPSIHGNGKDSNIVTGKVSGIVGAARKYGGHGGSSGSSSGGGGSSGSNVRGSSGAGSASGGGEGGTSAAAKGGGGAAVSTCTAIVRYFTAAEAAKAAAYFSGATSVIAAGDDADAAASASSAPSASSSPIVLMNHRVHAELLSGKQEAEYWRLIIQRQEQYQKLKQGRIGAGAADVSTPVFTSAAAASGFGSAQEAGRAAATPAQESAGYWSAAASGAHLSSHHESSARAEDSRRDERPAILSLPRTLTSGSNGGFPAAADVTGRADVHASGSSHRHQHVQVGSSSAAPATTSLLGRPPWTWMGDQDGGFAPSITSSTSTAAASGRAVAGLLATPYAPPALHSSADSAQAVNLPAAAAARVPAASHPGSGEASPRARSKRKRGFAHADPADDGAGDGGSTGDDDAAAGTGTDSIPNSGTDQENKGGRGAADAAGSGAGQGRPRRPPASGSATAAGSPQKQQHSKRRRFGDHS